ncbi:integrase [Pseudomonas fluorescens]|uniref:integrase n=1 Tax=Pseudomonas fluorescens TaxID=294 RepID=UPI002B1D4E0D|nr:integrase [Pseudomonas fluorescens]
MNPHLQYNNCIKGLEKMLNWSFANDVCLLDWTRADFESYAETVRSPSSAWVTSTIQPRFLFDAALDFEDCAINPNWKPFQKNRTGESFEEIDKNVWNREIRCVTQFMDFYLTEVSAKRENVALAKLEFLTFKTSQARGSISDEVMEWILSTLPSLPLSTHRSSMISMYLMIARHSGRPLWQVLGTASSPGLVDQFRRDTDGTWLESHPSNGSSVPLPAAFGRAFERYLIHLNIDARQPLPAAIMFPREDSADGLGVKSFRHMIFRIRENLAVMAMASDSPTISQASQDIRRLTGALVSSRPTDGV